MTPQEIAADIARELRENAKCWTRGCLARNQHGDGVDANSKHAVSWCLIGHIIKRTERSQGLVIGRFCPTLHAFLGECTTEMSLSEWNDSRRSVNSIIKLCEKVANS